MKTIRLLSLLILFSTATQAVPSEDLCSALNKLIKSSTGNFKSDRVANPVQYLGSGKIVTSTKRPKAWVSQLSFRDQAEAMNRYVDIIKTVNTCNINGSSFTFDEKMEAQLNKGWSKTATWTLAADHAYHNASVRLILSKADDAYTLLFEVTHK